MKKTSVQIDWLSISCLGSIIDECSLIRQNQSITTRQFACVDTYFYDSFEFMTVASKPQSKILHKDLIIIKINNRFLYSEIYKDILLEIIEKNKLQKVRISRLDLAVDFQYFENNRNPENLIKDFVNEKIIKKGKSKFYCIGKTDERINFQYLSFGSKSSNVNCYLYNKSAELEEVKNKEWIREKWKSSEFIENKAVWRLEFSLKNISSSLVSTLDGDFTELCRITSLMNEKLHKVYYILVEKYFSFKQAGNDSNKSRLKDIKLFDEKIENYVIQNLNESIQSNKLDKYFLKKLDLLFSELRSTDINILKSCELIKNEMIEKKKLFSYYENVINPYTSYVKTLPQTWGSELYLDIEKFNAVT